MTSFPIVFTEKQAQGLIPLLNGCAEHSTKKTARVLLGDLVNALTAQLNIIRNKEGQASDEKRGQEAMDAVMTLFSEQIPLILRRGMSGEVCAYIGKVTRAVDQFSNELECQKMDYRAQFSMDTRADVAPPADMFMKALRPTQIKIERATAAFISSEKQPLLSAKGYSHYAKRKSMAKACLIKGVERELGFHGGVEDVVENVCSFFSDLNSYVKLGTAFLRGNPRNIWKTYQAIDPYCRQSLPDEVLYFMDGHYGFGQLTTVKKPK